MKVFPIVDKSYYNEGMDLRDYFAAKAMQAYFTDQGVDWEHNTLELGAIRAYKLADAMMKARKE